MSSTIHTYISTLKNIIQSMSGISVSKVKMVLIGGIIGIGMFVPHSSQAQVTLTGTVFSDAGVTPQAVSKTIRIAVGTSTPSVFSTTSVTTTGAWSLIIPAGHAVSTSTPILVWIDNDVTTRGEVLTKSSSSQSVFSITGLDIYKDRVITRHEASSGTSTTLTDFAFYTSANDSDVQHSTSTGLLTIASGNELYVWAGKTFAPGSDVRILANATASSTDGSMYLAGLALYNASGTLTMGGSLTLVSTATFTNGQFPLIFNATTTGKTINAPVTSLGNVIFNGVGGGWSFASNATTTNLTILNGTITTPSVTIGVTGTYQNDATFNAGAGTLNIVGATTPTLADFVSLTTARDASGMIASTSATSASAFAIAGNTLYIAKAGGSQGCNSTASTSAGNCEILVFNIASTTNPIFTNALDAGGSNASTSNVGINALTVAGSMLYVGKAGSAVPCTQVAGTADGCEIMVFDISSTTNPIFRAGRDSGGSTNGTSATSTTAIKVAGSALYVSKAAGAGTCAATEGAGAGACEVLVFNISSTTNPLYIAGLDAGGNTSAGTQPLQVNSLEVVSNTLYAVKAGSPTTCNPTVGNAVGCELMVFNIASTTNPVFATGRDAGGSNASTSAIAMNYVVGSGTALYIGKAASAVPCTSMAGTADGCGVMVFDISSSTDPVYRRGVDGGGSYTGSQAIAINGLTLHKNYLFVAKAASAIVCSQVIGLAVGCELSIFDVASSSAIRMVAGRDAGGDSSGVQTLGINAVIGQGDALYVAKAGSGTSCAATAGNAIGCELMVFDISRPASGLLLGTMTGASTLGNVTASGIVEFRETASTSNLSIAAGTTTAPSALTVAGNYTNNATLVANEGIIYFASSTAQTISGTLVATSSLYRAVFAGAGTKTLAANASTSFLEILSGATVVAPSYLTVADTFTNDGTFNSNNSTLNTAGYFNEFVSGVSAGGAMTDSQGLAFNNFVNAGDIVYGAKAGNATTCSQVVGSAVGCELMVFDISNPANPIYRAGRDASGSSASTSATSTTALAISSTTLYVAKAGGSQGCNSTASTSAGNCELLVFSIASTTNPVFATALDAGGSNASTSNIGINQLVVAGNMLYVVKAASAVPCTQVAGTADGCELMVFDISSTTNPIYRAGRDASGNSAGTGNIGATTVAVSSSTLYVGKLGSATTCNPTAGSATDCELMVFDISSTTDPTFITARDSAGSNASTSAIAINSLSVSGSLLYVAKAASAIGCSQVVGSAAGCELMVFDISSTTNPIYRAGRDASGSSNGTGNIAANFVAASGTNVYITKAGDATACSQIAGSAIGCEVMSFDIGSSTNPIYIKGRDTGADVDGRTSVAAQTVLFTSNHIVVGRASDVTGCEQIKGLRIGCEMMLFKSPTTLSGTLTGASGLATVTTNGLTKFVANASTTHLTIATSSMLIASTTELSASGDVSVLGTYVPGTATFSLQGRNQRITNTATTTFYNLRQQATTTATTTFGTNAPFVVLNNLTLEGTSAAALKLRSVSNGVAWKISPQSSTTIIARYLDVQDSNNISTQTATITCDIGCTNSGNNTNWNFINAAPIWNATDWTLYDTITIQEENIDSDLTNFPVYVNLDDLSGIFWSTTPTGSTTVGTDIRVTTAANVEVPRELVFASSTLQNGELHFKAPSLSSTTDTVFKIWYNGNTLGDYTDTATYGAENVWSNDYLGVWHISESANNTPGGYRDSTRFQNHGTGTSMTSAVAGRVGNGQDFDGVADRITVPRASILEPTTSITFSTWLKREGVQVSYAKPFYYGNDTAPGYGPYGLEANISSDANYLMTLSSASTNTTNAIVGLNDATWYNVQGTYDGAVYRSYNNAVEVSSTTAVYTIGGYGTLGLGIGDFGDSTSTNAPFNGIIDEVRIASTTRPASWIKAEYYNQATSTDFYSVELAAPVWNATDWTLYDTITIQEENIDSDLTNFPVYVNLDDLSSTFWSTTPAGATRVGSDIRITTAANVEVPRELVSASSTQGIGELHFKAPSLSSTTDTIFKIWYNGTTTGDYTDTATYGAENVWTNDFVAVYHLQEDPSAGVGAVIDSTRFNHDGTGSTTMTSADLVTGKVGRAHDFDGALTDRVTFATSSAFANLNTVSVCTWYQHDTYPNAYGGIVDKSSDGTDSWNMYLDSDGRFALQSRAGGIRIASTTAGGEWQYLCSAANGAVGGAGIALYLNGINTVGTSQVFGAGSDDTNTPLTIGSGKTAYRIDGRMDEVRIASTTRPASWIKAEYYNQATSTDFYGVNLVGAVGSSTIANHTAGQVTNNFTGADKTNESLFAFRLTPNSGTATVTDAVIGLSGVQGFNPATTFTNLRLFRDLDNDAQYDASDVAVGGTGVVTGSNQEGAVTFSTDFLSTTSQNYVVVGDWSAPTNGSFVTFALPTSGLTIIDATSSQSVFGSVTSVQHSRNNRGGGGGGNASVGGDGPGGAGNVGGGGNTGGESIGTDPDFFLPSSNSGSWTNGANAYDGVDGTYASTSAANNHSYTNHGFSIPSANVISGIIVKLELSGSTAAGTVDVQLSWDGGTSWTSSKTSPTLTTSDAVRTLGSPSDLWGRTWSSSEFSNGNFAIRITGAPSSNTIRLDAIQLRVYHTTGGGGSGGGSGGGGI